MIEAVIHVHNRVEYLERIVISAIESSKDLDVFVRISCNATDQSSKDRVATIADLYNIPVRYVEKSKAYDHFLGTIKLTSAKYICLLHDDDILGKNFFYNIKQLTKQFPTAGAYSVNNSYMIEGVVKKPTVQPSRAFQILPSALCVLYLAGRSGPAFPSMVYRTELANNIFYHDTRFQKYTDAAIVYAASRYGLIVDHRCEFTYVINEVNDSRSVDWRARRKLYCWLVNRIFKDCTKKDLIDLRQNITYFIGRFLKS